MHAKYVLINIYMTTTSKDRSIDGQSEEIDPFIPLLLVKIKRVKIFFIALLFCIPIQFFSTLILVEAKETDIALYICFISYLEDKNNFVTEWSKQSNEKYFDPSIPLISHDSVGAGIRWDILFNR